nr:hypothetical protein [Candidatus Sigynarchaeota archaeon]
MSKITRTEGLVLLILALGTACLFNSMARRASGLEASLVSVMINGQDLTSHPGAIVEARLRTSLEINVTWKMLYDLNATQTGWMQISLYNNASLVRSSALFTESGSNNNRVWFCPLVPEEWTLANYREYGRVEVALKIVDNGILGVNQLSNFTIRVLPEQVNVSLSSYTFKNESNGRMDHLNASYHVTSVQDPSFHHPNLCFSCEIFDVANSRLHEADFHVDTRGFLDVIIEDEYLIFLEGERIRVTNHATTLIEPITIETNMEAIVNRTDFLLYYHNLTETYDGNAVSIGVNLDVGMSANWSSVLDFPLYYEWTVSNTTGTRLQNGSAFAFLGAPISIGLDASFTPIIEYLFLDLWFEGNFFFKSKQVSISLGDQVIRKEIDIYLANQGELIEAGIGDIRFQLNVKQAMTPVPYHPARIEIVNETTGGSLSVLVCITDENGCATMPLSGGMLRDLEHVQVVVKALANLTFKESTKAFSLANFFTRMTPSLRLNNVSSGLILHTNVENEISMSILVDGDVEFFSGRLAELEFFTGDRGVIQEYLSIIRSGGIVTCPIPAHALQAGMTVYVHVVIDATLVSQELSATVSFRVVAIVDGTGNVTMQAWMAIIFLLGAVFGVILSIKCVKRIRQGFLSKDQFTITLA